MEGFLNFLSNNYLYFLIAAGVLLFALIGFLVDLKKKNNKEEEVLEEAPLPEVSEPLQTVAAPKPSLESAVGMTTETFSPTPPMPPVEKIPAPVVPNVEPTPTVPTTPQQPPIEEINIEEFK